MNSLMSKYKVDCHFHVFNAGVSVEGARYTPAYSALLSDWVIQAQSAGVNRGVCVQPSFLGVDNSLMVSALKAYPDRLRGVAVVKADASAHELKALNSAGVRGIRLNLAGLSPQIPEWTHADTVWDAMHALGWHLEVHTDSGHLPKILAQLPSDMPLVVDHMAKPGEATAKDPSFVALVKHAKNSAVHVKLSGAYRLGRVNATTAAKILLNELGPKALLWGSDWPCTNHERFAHFENLIADAHDWIGSRDFHQVMVLNPSSLYWSET